MDEIDLDKPLGELTVRELIAIVKRALVEDRIETVVSEQATKMREFIQETTWRLKQ